MKYALVMYMHTDNLGDDIQTYAALKYLPHIDYIIDREKLSEFQTNEKTKMILNGWYMYDFLNWPPSSNIDVLPISLHFAPSFIKNKYEKELFEYKTKKYFSNFDKIGCRDEATSQYLNSLGIKNYISNCLTLTIDKFDIEKEKKDYICSIDLTEEENKKLKTMTDMEIKIMTHDFRGNNLDNLSFDERMIKVEEYLKIYQNAKVVVTTRYHAAMPSIALGTPVILIPSKFEPTRYDGLKDIIPIITEEEFLKESFKYDFKNPKKNSDITEIKKNIEDKCYNFIKRPYKKIVSKKDNLEDSYLELLKDYERKLDELNNRDRVNYYKNLDMEKYIERNF